MEEGISYMIFFEYETVNSYEWKRYIHPVNLTWPFMVAGKPENDLKEVVTANRLCGTTAS